MGRSRLRPYMERISDDTGVSGAFERVIEGERVFQNVRNRKCQRASTRAWTMAEAKMEPVLRHVQP